jgi:HPt (histidine-containing phosphotransfer) domain-containing protein
MSESLWPEHLSECFDLESLRTFGGLDEDEFFHELAEAFLEDSPGRIQTIQASLSTAEFDAIKDEAHSLKGSSRKIYASKMGDACETVEKAAESNDTAAMSESVQSLVDEYARVENALNKMLELA